MSGGFNCKVYQEISRVLKGNLGAFKNDPRWWETLRQLRVLDRRFKETGGIFFHTGSNAFETAQKFTEIHVERYRQSGRPSLPALALHHAEQLGLEKDSPAYKALILVSVRAEMKAAVMPDYHSKFHYMDVGAMTANLLEKNNEMLKARAADAVVLTPQDQALTFIAAIGHDLDHDGHVNPPHDPLFNENKSFHLMEPLLQEAGLSAVDIGRIYIILMTTSPDGPHAVMKGVARAQREGTVVDFSVIDPKNKFPELHVLGQDSKLAQMAAIVSDSDLYASSGAGIKSSNLMGTLLTAEMRKDDPAIDLTTYGADKYFLDNIVGKEGYASNAGRRVAAESLAALRKHVESHLSKPAKPPSLKQGKS